jgi:hypothetical protein
MSESCSGASPGVHEAHCLHDLPDKHEAAPGQVCCWCGDLYVPRLFGEHGEYLPTSRALALPRGWRKRGRKDELKD